MRAFFLFIFDSFRNLYFLAFLFSACSQRLSIHKKHVFSQEIHTKKGKIFKILNGQSLPIFWGGPFCFAIYTHFSRKNSPSAKSVYKHVFLVVQNRRFLEVFSRNHCEASNECIFVVICSFLVIFSVPDSSGIDFCNFGLLVCDNTIAVDVWG